MNTKIKICGLTTPEEADYLNKQHVDFAGFVLFFEKSKRNITIAQSEGIASHLLPEIKRVAVVVSPSLDEIEQIQNAATRFDYIQIHGSLSDELLEHIKLPVLKAFNVTDMKHYEQYHQCDKIAGYVFDAIEPGSGKTFDWNLVKNIPHDEKLLLLAGGLSADNVTDAINALHPDGVDVSSGVEFLEKPGKDPEKIKQFVANVRLLSAEK